MTTMDLLCEVSLGGAFLECAGSVERSRVSFLRRKCESNGDSDEKCNLCAGHFAAPLVSDTLIIEGTRERAGGNRTAIHRLCNRRQDVSIKRAPTEADALFDLCWLLFADRCHILVGLFARDVDVLSDSRDGCFSCARGCLYDRTFFVRAANDVEALFRESREGAAND